MSDKINIKEILKKHSKNVNTKLSAGYSLSGKETLTVQEVLAAIKEIANSIVDKCVEKAETYEYPYLDACPECGHTATYIDEKSILQVKDLIDYA